MKKKLLLLLVLLVLFALFIVFRYFLFNQQAKDGQLKVLSSPNASVFLDNVAVGKTPFESKLTVGEHLIKLIPEGVATDTASWQGKVQIHENSLTFVERVLGTSDLTSAGVIFTVEKMKDSPRDPNTGSIEIETEPTGAIVSLDNDEKGIAPLILTDVLKGDHELSVYAPGFFRRTQKINVVPRHKVFAQFKLALDPDQKDIDTLPPKEEDVATDSGALAEAVQITIRETPTGWLRVRDEPTLSGSESARVNPQDTFALLEERAGWYKIEYVQGKFGWISANYAEKGTNATETPDDPTANP